MPRLPSPKSNTSISTCSINIKCPEGFGRNRLRPLPTHTAEGCLISRHRRQPSNRELYYATRINIMGAKYWYLCAGLPQLQQHHYYHTTTKNVVRVNPYIAQRCAHSARRSTKKPRARWRQACWAYMTYYIPNRHGSRGSTPEVDRQVSGQYECITQLYRTILELYKTRIARVLQSSTAHLETAIGRVVLETDITSTLVVLLSHRNTAGEESRPRRVGTPWPPSPYH